ncbi:hypothetical protein [Simplicispira lacusdiani]|uniref:hypothetical protein n=1 Tax=Simplicispira lacusdiani TaxID=2213010 RepID=UPI000E744D75|nr:hypothetical protein [Simplicispira lacusdiani]
MENNPDLKVVTDSFPHIGKVLRQMWGAPEVTDYIDTLLYDTRDGGRQGFPREVMAALMNIYTAHAGKGADGSNPLAQDAPP